MYSGYSAAYLNLRARQGKLQAFKVGRNWVTTTTWIEEFREKKDIDIPEVAEAYRSDEHGVGGVHRPLSVFAAFRFGVVTAAIVLLLSAGTAFSKDAWYQLGRELAGSVQDFGEGFAYGISSPAAVGDVAGEYAEWLRQGILTLPQNVVRE